jgi:hypothetical protein
MTTMQLPGRGNLTGEATLSLFGYDNASGRVRGKQIGEATFVRMAMTTKFPHAGRGAAVKPPFVRMAMTTIRHLPNPLPGEATFGWQ